MTVQFETRPIEDVQIGDMIRWVGVVRNVHDTGRTLIIVTDNQEIPALKDANITMEVVIRG